MTTTCGTCRFKGEPITRIADVDPWRVVETGYFLCALIKQVKTQQTEPDYPSAGSAYVEDGSGYHAALCVADDFGCNRWQAVSISPDNPQ